MILQENVKLVLENCTIIKEFVLYLSILMLFGLKYRKALVEINLTPFLISFLRLFLYVLFCVLK